ncbi:hypothetical protein LTR24_006899 [Lithohypha guttulata]|uniref:Uncharacterized protein n=1 Tax=Lithohypha guttulata TaxID=1690604 RepID=A0ABR0K4K4_9EURO|nr:hypothetical protein LTR24_006899 [Lithohypha guttulata]
MPSATSIFNLPSSKSTSHAPKIHISHTQLPQTYLDPSQPPTTRHPFKQIRAVSFARNLTLCMPTRVYNSLYGNRDHDHDHDHAENTPANPEHPLASASRGPEQRCAYAKVLMTLSDVLSDHALRTGNHALFSAPCSPGANSVAMRLDCGTLTLDMPQTTYQRSGLTFPLTKTESGGRKHGKGSGRFRVEIDLRGPAMVKGRKGFERLVYASGSVEGLREGRVWLFCEVGGGGRKGKGKRKRGEEVTMSSSAAPRATTATSDSSREREQHHPLAKHHPTLIVEPGTTTTQHDVLVPGMISRPEYLCSLSTRSSTSTSTSASKAEHANGNGCPPTILEDDVHELVEYLGLLCLGSPRITKRDYGRVDLYLCRYVLPTVEMGPKESGAGGGKAADVGDTGSEEGEIESGTAGDKREGDADVRVEDVTSVRYSGFMSSEFVMQLVVDLIRRSRVRKSGEGSALGRNDKAAWMAISVDAFQMEAKGWVDGYLILLQSGEAGGAGGGAAEEMSRKEGSIEGGRFERRHHYGPNEKLDGKQSREVRGFRYATCFEFVDSMSR